MTSLTTTAAWRALAAHATQMQSRHLRELFAADPARAQRFTLEFDEIYLDYSKQRINAETMTLLLALAEQADINGWIRRMFAGDTINESEGRAVLHVALRADLDEFPRGRSVMAGVREARQKMREFVARVREGKLQGASGQVITDVVNIGIGGSDLGPRLLVQALASEPDKAPRVHFVSNVDPAELDAMLASLRPAQTLFVVASKTFTTVETLHNAQRARLWLGGSLAMKAHFAAVTENSAAAHKFGVDAELTFPLWDWVGGRFSIWSPVGLSAAIAMGNEHFDAFLEGARQMDAHFHTAEPGLNLPVVLALMSIWNSNFLGARSHAVLPYSHALRSLPAYLQQLEMESNGKQVDRDGQPLDYTTAPLLWGSSGTVSQHSYHQLLHQGTTTIPVDFIVPLHAPGEVKAQSMLVSNALAQGAALLSGTAPGTPPHRATPGNRPSNTLLIERLTPQALGQLIALYEHKVFIQGVIWNINSFDQWGVELGKTIARSLSNGGLPPDMDASTAALLARARRT